MESAGGLTDKKIKVNNSEYDPATDEGKYFYINPYVGRVLDGCAFYEKSGSTTRVLENTDKNYQIATINPDDPNKITTEVDYNPSGNNYPTKAENALFMITTVKDAQNLLILSAITNSGAAGGGIYSESGTYHSTPWYASYAYYSLAGSYFGNTSFGKARNASYQDVGKQQETTSGDFIIANRDDHELVSYKNASITEESNTPYLIGKYTDGSRMTYFYAANLTRVSLEFSGDTEKFDMSGYQSGYRGIGGRYKSSSVQTEASKYNADRNTPFTRNFDGGNKQLQLAMNVKEYKDDNYHAIGVGGVFNVLQQDTQSTDKEKNIKNKIEKITISGSVQLSYYELSANTINSEDKNVWTVGVGGLVGRSANRGITGGRGNGYYADVQKVKASDLTVSAPYNAGGVIGLGGVSLYAVTNGLRHSDAVENYFAAHFTECELKNVTITSTKNAGGLLGWGASNVKDETSQTLNPDNVADSCNAEAVKVNGIETGNGSDSAGVFFGKCDGSLTVTSSSVTNFSVKANYAGMVSGQIRANSDRTFSATDTNITGDNSDNSTLEATACAGGLVGYSGVKSTMERCTISNTSITAKTEGGLVGEVTQQSDLYGCKVSGVKFNNPSNSTSTLAGALVGKLSAGLTGGNLLWDTNTYENGITTKGTWIGSVEKKENNKIQLAGVSRKDTKKSTSLSDVGSDEYDGYISYADYSVENNVDRLPDVSVQNDYPEAKFDKNQSLTLVKEEFIYLGEGSWTIEADSKSYVQIDDKNLLTAKEVGTARITKENVTYTINVVESFVGTEILLKN